MDTNIYRLIERVHVPGVNRVLAAKLAQWEKGTIATHQEEYDKARKSFCNDLFVVPRQEKAPGADRMYWFELMQYGTWQWRMVNLFPWRLPDDDQYKVLPKDIIDKMSEFPVEPGKVVTMAGAHSTLLNKTVDVQFVRYSSTHIFGTVKQSITGPQQIHWEGDMETAFRIFYICRGMFPETAATFVNEFMAKVLPGLLESGKGAGNQANPAKDKYPGQLLPGKGLLEKEHKGKDTEPRDLHVELKGEESLPFRPGQAVEESEDGDVNLYRLIQLIQIPEFNKLILLKLHELCDGSQKREIEAYKVKYAYYYKKLFWDLRRKRKKKIRNKGRPVLYWFVLTKFAPADWGMTVIDPQPPDYENFKDILPGMVFCLFNHTPVHPGKVLKASVQLPAPYWKKIDLQWVRYSSNCVMGTVCENMDDLQTLLAEENEWLKGSGSNGMEKGSLYRLLFHHIRCRPRLAESFINRFMAEMLPRVNALKR